MSFKSRSYFFTTPLTHRTVPTITAILYTVGKNISFWERLQLPGFFRAVEEKQDILNGINFEYRDSDGHLFHRSS
jgi:hypothetical protein